MFGCRTAYLYQQLTGYIHNILDILGYLDIMFFKKDLAQREGRRCADLLIKTSPECEECERLVDIGDGAWEGGTAPSGTGESEGLVEPDGDCQRAGSGGGDGR